MTKETIQEIVKMLDNVYAKMGAKEKLLAAYQLRDAVNNELMEFHYGHIIFADDNISIDNIKLCIDWISGKIDRSPYPKANKVMNIPAIELLVCLSHMELKDRIKIIYRKLNWIDSDFSDLLKQSENDSVPLIDEIEELYNAGYKNLEQLKEERDSELNEFIKQGLLDSSIFIIFN